MVGQPVNPLEQLPVQSPAEQTWPAPQGTLQLPQWFTSVWKFTQKALAPVPQALGVAAGQLHEAGLPPQRWPAGQTLPQLPQLLASVASAAQ